MRPWPGVVVLFLAAGPFWGPVDAVEPVSMAVGGVAVAVSAGFAWYSALRCRHEECCDEPWIRKISEYRDG